MGKGLVIIQEIIERKIYFIRGRKVMFDHDLAALYAVSTKALNQAVKRNKKRFPEDFMFELNKKETEIWLENLRSQIVTSSWGGRRYSIFAIVFEAIKKLLDKKEIPKKPIGFDIT